MADGQIAHWTAKLERATRWRDRMWLVFSLTWAALIAMIFIAMSVSLSVDFLLAAFLLLFFAWLVTLIAAIAFTGNARVARQQIAHLEKQHPASAQG